jgi:hypothetical protein
MSVYAAILSGSGSTALDVGVKAGIYPIKILNISTLGNTAYTITEFAATATLTGGSVITPFPLRFAAPAASATSRSAAPTGTSTPIVPTTANNGVANYTPLASMILPVGAAIGVHVPVGTLITVTFDELEIQPGY